MTQSDKDRGKHFAVKAENLAPARIVCKCGPEFVGSDAFVLMKAHMDAQDAMEKLEKEMKLERRNVFDRDDTDEEAT